MADLEDIQDGFESQENQAVYIFNPDGEGVGERPSKRRKTSKMGAATKPATIAREMKGRGGLGESCFVKLMDGKEMAEWMQTREGLFEEGWGGIEERVKRILRDANQATLDEVNAFVQSPELANGTKIPCGFIITGPNIASQNLLFEQLEESLLASTPSRFVRLRSADATNLKATLRKIIRDGTSRVGDDEDEQLAVGQSGRKYLNYDLEALHEFVASQERCDHVFVAFQDSEGFDSLLLSDLVLLFSTWRPQIPFTLLFGVATSVELLQARLLKSTCEHVHGAQFDVVQSNTVLERVTKAAVAAHDVRIRIGPSLLRSLISRQEEQVAGVQAFVSSLKYSYMCHFYANPLSIFLSSDASDPRLIQPEHLEGIRSLPSFKRHVEESVKNGDLKHAKSLLEDDAYLIAKIQEALETKKGWTRRLLRSIQILSAIGLQKGSYTRLFIDAMAQGIDASSESPAIDILRKMEPEGIITVLKSMRRVLEEGDNTVHLAPGSGDPNAISTLKKLIAEGESLVAMADEEGNTLRTKYSGQTKVVRTTVIAQKVQLSHDSAALTDEDKAFTALVDTLAELVRREATCAAASSLFLHEIWLYDSKSPYSAVFVPKPRGIFERALTRPHDYLGCSCCSVGEGGISATAPAVSVLYRLYQEGGSLVNVADLWSAFYEIVGDDDDEDGERKALVQFYRGLAELKCLGFVKGSKKKADHIAKLKWL